jgi:hypothetical protein
VVASASWSLILSIDVQKADLGILGLAFQKEVLWKYFALRILVVLLSGSVAIFQAAMIIRALLTASRFLTPKPPFLDLHICDQALK